MIDFELRKPTQKDIVRIHSRINERGCADQARKSVEHAPDQPREIDAVFTSEDEFQAELFKGFVGINPTKAEGLDYLMSKYGNGVNLDEETKPIEGITPKGEKVTIKIDIVRDENGELVAVKPNQDDIKKTAEKVRGERQKNIF